MAGKCGTCEATIPSQNKICYDCTTALEVDLAKVAAVWTSLRTTATRQDKGMESVGRSSQTAPLPFNDTASDAGLELRRMLVCWGLRIINELVDEWRDTCNNLRVEHQKDQLASDEPMALLLPPKPVIPSYEPVKLGRWLLFRSEHIKTKDYAPDMKAELHRRLLACERVTDRHGERIDVGRCGYKYTEDGACPERLTAYRDQPHVECRACGTVWDVKDRQRSAILAAWTHLDTMPTILRALKSYDIHIKPKDAENWVRLQHVTPAEATEGKPKLYRVSDVYEVHMRMVQRRRKVKAA